MIVPTATSAESAPILARSSTGLLGWRSLRTAPNVGVENEFAAELFEFRFILSSHCGNQRTRPKAGFLSSLRRHYPDQVQRVDGERSHPLSRVYPSSPLIEETKIRVL